MELPEVTGCAAAREKARLPMIKMITNLNRAYRNNLPVVISAMSWRRNFGRSIQQIPWVFEARTSLSPEYYYRPAHCTGGNENLSRSDR